MEYIFVLAALALVLVAVVFKTLFSASSRGDTILLLGEVGSGKTQLFFQLYQGSGRETVTSQKENDLKFVPAELKGVSKVADHRYVDFPGHGSYRYKLPSFYKSLKAVIFVVDGTDSEKFQAVAESLSTLLKTAEVVSKKVPILVAFNKADLEDEFIAVQKSITKIETYMEKSRHLTNAVADLGEDEAQYGDIGQEGKPFAFKDAAVSVQTCTISAKEHKSLDSVISFIKDC